MRKQDTKHPSDFWRSSVPRGFALFFGGFALLNLIGEFRAPGFDSNLWWIDLRVLPSLVAKGLLLFISLLLIAFTFAPPVSRGRQLVTGGLSFVIAILALINAGQFYSELLKG